MTNEINEEAYDGMIVKAILFMQDRTIIEGAYVYDTACKKTKERVLESFKRHASAKNYDFLELNTATIKIIEGKNPKFFLNQEAGGSSKQHMFDRLFVATDKIISMSCTAERLISPHKGEI